MAPALGQDAGDIAKPEGSAGLTLEAWAQGYMVGSLIVMAAITVANMRRGVLLHKLILIELLFGMPHGTFIFPSPPAYGWYLSITAVFLNTSWFMHNVIAWLKNKPFLSRNLSLFYIGTVLLTIPYWIVEMYANFTYFNNINDLFHHTRPWEALCRDPWWIFTTCNLFYNIITKYEFNLVQLVRISPRFGVLLGAMCLSVAFIIVDILSVTGALTSSLPEGINPFWKLAFVFKCLTDTIILDDFKTALDKLKQYRMQRSRIGSASFGPESEGERAMGLDGCEGGGRTEGRRGTVAYGPYNESMGVTDAEKLDFRHREVVSSMEKRARGEHVKNLAVEQEEWGQRLPAAEIRVRKADSGFSQVDPERGFWGCLSEETEERGESSKSNG